MPWDDLKDAKTWGLVEMNITYEWILMEVIFYITYVYNPSIMTFYDMCFLFKPLGKWGLV